MKTLVAIDGSAASFAALRGACRMAARTGAYVTAFYVNKGAEYSAEEVRWLRLKEKIEEELETRGHEIVRRAQEVGREFGLAVEGIMASGVPAEELARYVGDHGIVNLVALGHTSKGRGTQGFVGSTTRMAVTMVDRAAFFITSRDEPIARILVAVDDSDVSLKAVAAAGRLAKSLAASVRVVAVFPDTDAITREYRQIAEVPNLDKYLQESKSTLRAKADLAVEKAREALAPQEIDFAAVIQPGYPPDVIVEASREADLMVIGLKSKVDQKKIGRILGKLLNHHEITLLCVQ